MGIRCMIKRGSMNSWIDRTSASARLMGVNIKWASASTKLDSTERTLCERREGRESVRACIYLDRLCEG